MSEALDLTDKNDMTPEYRDALDQAEKALLRDLELMGKKLTPEFLEGSHFMIISMVISSPMLAMITDIPGMHAVVHDLQEKYYPELDLEKAIPHTSEEMGEEDAA